MMNLPPALMQPPPRDPAGAAQFLQWRIGLAARILGGLWLALVLLVGVAGVNEYVTEGDSDALAGALVLAGIGVLIALAIMVGTLRNRTRGTALYVNGVPAWGKVRAVHANVQPDFPAKIEIDFQEMDGRPGFGYVMIAWTKVSWLTPGMPVSVLYVPGNAKLFGVFADPVGVVPGTRKS